jgi:pimeloyl-ACP methyl ester carboxylesterase
MTTYCVIHGAAGNAWYWHVLAGELRERGNHAVAMDLPCDDDEAGLSEYANTVVDAIGDRTDLVVVATSFGGFTAPRVFEPMPVELS